MLNLIANLNAIAFLFLGLILIVTSLTNIEALFTWEVLAWQVAIHFSLHIIDYFFVAEPTTWASLGKSIDRKDSHTELSLFGFKWNSVFSH